MSEGLKHIYLVRHGETLKNRTHIHQGPNEPLSELGEQQAKHVATWLGQKKFDALFSSHLTRAQQTANYISQAIELPVSTEESLQEFRRPLELYGKHHFSPGSLDYILDFYLHRRDPDWNNDGAENLVHVQNRIEETRTLFESHPGNNLVAVSHSIYMDMFKRQLTEDRPLTAWQFLTEIILNKRIPNTGVLHFTFDASGDTVNSWQLIEEIHPTSDLKIK